MFPQGGPGIGLLLLRIVVATMFTLNVTDPFYASGSSLLGVVVVLAGLIWIGLLAGFFTLVLAIITLAAAVANLLLSVQTIDVLYSMLTSAALILLGPGAYSVDAKLYGLRVHVVPPRKDK